MYAHYSSQYFDNCSSKRQLPIDDLSTNNELPIDDLRTNNEVAPVEIHENQQQFHMAPFAFPQLYRCLMKIEDQPQSNEYGSQSHEDSWLYDKIFSKSPDMIGGTFIEIGALDGRTYSNTLYFEKKWDWRGILIEGHPGNQAALRANQDFRKNSAIFTVAICNLTSEGKHGELKFTPGGGAVGASTEMANPAFLKAWHGLDYSGGLKSACIPLQTILESTGLYDINLFSLDVEGAEYAVLSTVDWSVTNFEVIVVELDGGDLVKDQHVRDLLLSHGFENAALKHGSIRDACVPGGDCTINEVFINPNFQNRKLQRAASMGASSTRFAYGTGMSC
uniref:Methyltransferase FkbM domain-containing protein n=1 Tax=Cryptomonas curvata TaxID=233186 RepID=A0A7S0QQG9_9CRYP